MNEQGTSANPPFNNANPSSGNQPNFANGSNLDNSSNFASPQPLSTPSYSPAPQPPSAPSSTFPPASDAMPAPVAPSTPQPPIQPATPFSSSPQISPLSPPASPSVQSQLAPPQSQKSSLSILTIVIIVIISLVATTFIGLFVWMYFQWDAAKTDVDGQIQKASAIAVKANADKLESDFIEREKYPYNKFSSPEEFGSLSFEYPKTWSVYVANDKTGDKYEAFLHPGVVNAINRKDIYALRISIINQRLEKALEKYNRAVEDGKMSLTIREVGGENANLFVGTLPDNKDLQGNVLIIKIRDKVAIIQSDAMAFNDDYHKILDSVTYNK